MRRWEEAALAFPLILIFGTIRAVVLGVKWLADQIGREGLND